MPTAAPLHTCADLPLTRGFPSLPQHVRALCDIPSFSVSAPDTRATAPKSAFGVYGLNRSWSLFYWPLDRPGTAPVLCWTIRAWSYEPAPSHRRTCAGKDMNEGMPMNLMALLERQTQIGAMHVLPPGVFRWFPTPTQHMTRPILWPYTIDITW